MTVRRSEFLQALSREHHQGLYVALRLKRATADSEEEARRAFLEFWRADGRQHFRLEEEILLPAYARHRPVDEPAVVRVLTDHIELRRLAADLEADEAAPPGLLHELGTKLEQHIRHEERTLFPAIEAALSSRELRDVAERLDRAESSG
jgi:hemerythrin-like domain-containing protein